MKTCQVALIICSCLTINTLSQIQFTPHTIVGGEHGLAGPQSV